MTPLENERQQTLQVINYDVADLITLYGCFLYLVERGPDLRVLSVRLEGISYDHSFIDSTVKMKYGLLAKNI